ncbi:helix-turn-helix domain-containing protein [Candidatus Bipolaricaulota bacterium]|nr:helix-turn-helix domain-containing protein [Candidatus Bipolaricaulota bacterium]
MIDAIEDLREEFNVSKEQMARKLDVNLRTYQNWFTEDVEPSYENKRKMEELINILLYTEYLYCGQKGLFLITYDRDRFGIFQPCPICNEPACDWGYKSFDEVFRFEDIEGPDPEKLFYWIEDFRIIYDPKNDERFEGTIEKTEAP